MNKFNILTWIGSIIVGIPTLLVCTIAITLIFNNRGVSQSIIDNNTYTQLQDTVYIEKVVEKVKVDTFYVKVPQPQVKAEPPKDTL